MAAEPNGRDLFLRNTDADGVVSVLALRTWDAARLLEAYRANAAQANERADKSSPRLARVEQITRAQYLAERRP